MLRSRFGLTLLLALIFTVNWVETAAESRWSGGRVSNHGYEAANAMQRWERSLFGQGFSFENHDVTNRLAVYGYSISYFVVFPLLGLAVGIVLARRDELAGFRTVCVAAAIDYVVSLLFFLLYPVPERWAYPDSGAILLSDVWSSKLIEAFRPLSGLDNCFPSFHVSLTVILIIVAYQFQLRFRTVVLALGLTIILSTFVLGVHWVSDMAAGTALGALSVVLALRLSGTTAGWQPIHSVS